MRRDRTAPTRAMVLGAGLGTRLRPLTERTPKCMVTLGGRPILEHTLAWLRRYGVTAVVINLHHLPDAVTGYFGDGTRWGIRIRYSLEPELLGTAGAVRNVASFFDAPFFVWYGDNVSHCRLDRLWAFHEARGATATIALWHRDDVTHSGIVAVDDRDRVTRFLEKPASEEVFSRWVNAGIFVLEPRVLELISAGRAVDFGREVFPELLARQEAIYGYRMSADEGLWWIDCPEDLYRLRRAWATISAPGEGGFSEKSGPQRESLTGTTDPAKNVHLPTDADADERI